MIVEFMVKLIEVKETSCNDARDNLYSNCTHVGKDYWLFEGNEEALHDGIDFEIVGECAIEGTGDLTGSEIKKMVVENYGIERTFIY